MKCLGNMKCSDKIKVLGNGHACELIRSLAEESRSSIKEKERVMKRLVYALYRRREKILILLVGLFFGMLVGIFLAPVKNGVTIGSYNGSYGEKKKEEEDEFNQDLAMEMGELR